MNLDDAPDVVVVVLGELTRGNNKNGRKEKVRTGDCKEANGSGRTKGGDELRCRVGRVVDEAVW